MAGCRVAATPLAAFAWPQHLVSAQSLSPSAENRGLKAKRGCHSGQSRLSRGKKRSGGAKSQSFVWWECQVTVLLGAEVLVLTRRGGRAKGTTGQHESGEKSHILPSSSLPELSGVSSGAGPGCVTFSAQARHPHCCLQSLHAGVREGVLRAWAVPLCTHCQTSPGGW